MAFERPTLVQLVDRIQGDFVSRLERASATLRRAVVYILARVFAGAAHMMHAHLEFLGLQLFPDKSVAEFLIRQAGLFGITKNEADYAKANVSITGTNGAIVDAGTVLLKDGLEYEVDADVTIAAGVGTLALTAVDAGSEANLSVGMVLNFQSPVSGVSSTATVTAVTQDGTDEESTEELRTRFLERLAEPPQGGSDADYIAWAKEVAGVTRVWVTPLGLGPGTVVVRFVRDNDVSIFPDAGEVAAVQAKFNEKKPAHATVTAIAPVAAPIDFTLHIVPDNTAMRNAVIAELEDYLKRTASPGATILLSGLRTTIGNTPGLTDYTLTTPAADVTNAVNQLATRGTMTWT
jgi:uncharacterized phage protein gp47/JayE